MPWKETQKMDQKVMFVQKALNPQANFRQLCREYGISAKTGYKWMERFEMGGLSGLAEASRRPRSHAKQLCESVVCEIIALKLAHKHWGPKKIRVLYGRRHHEVPSETSFKRVLDKTSLTTHRRLRRSRQGGRIHQGKTAHGSRF
jgi:transposase-like protein